MKVWVTLDECADMFEVWSAEPEWEEFEWTSHEHAPVNIADDEAYRLFGEENLPVTGEQCTEHELTAKYLCGYEVDVEDEDEDRIVEVIDLRGSRRDPRDDAYRSRLRG